MASRFTIVYVEPPALDELQQDYGPLLCRRLGGGTAAPVCVRYMFEALEVIERLQPRIARRISLRTLVQWADFVKVRYCLSARLSSPPACVRCT